MSTKKERKLCSEWKLFHFFSMNQHGYRKPSIYLGHTVCSKSKLRCSISTNQGQRITAPEWARTGDSRLTVPERRLWPLLHARIIRTDYISADCCTLRTEINCFQSSSILVIFSPRKGPCETKVVKRLSATTFPQKSTFRGFSRQESTISRLVDRKIASGFVVFTKSFELNYAISRGTRVASK